MQQYCAGVKNVLWVGAILIGRTACGREAGGQALL